MQFPPVSCCRCLFLASLVAFCSFGAAAKAPISSISISVQVDLRDAYRKLIHAELDLPVQAGPLTLLSPKWIPGEHSPTGPINDLAGLTISAEGKQIAWTRDDTNMFAFHLTVPAGVQSLHVRADFLPTATPSGFSAGASTGPNLAMLSWNTVVLYPAGELPSELQFDPSVRLPAEWKLGTSLPVKEVNGDTTRFAPVSLPTLIDSPVLAGKFFREVPLAEEVTPKHFLDMAADGPEDLNVSPEQLASYSQLVREIGAVFHSRHYASYHFLLTLSDGVAHFGLEHHESSDDRVAARALIDDDMALLNGDLLPHEFTHSWNGKYRRPAGLLSPDYQTPMKGELLWVYEGLTQYLGDVLAARSGIWTPDQYRAYLAQSAAQLDHRPGRTWRNLQDTATAAQILYDTPDDWDNWRRGVDYYAEGELIWLEVDMTIRSLSKNARSLNDFCESFFGPEGTAAASVKPYAFMDLVTALGSVQPFDWTGFFEERLHSKSPRAPLEGVVKSGYKLVYNDQSNDYEKAEEASDRGIVAWYSLGFDTKENVISDVLVQSPAFVAGLGPGMKLVAVNGRQASDEVLRKAIHDSKGTTAPINLIVENAGFYKVLNLDYHNGEQHPHLERIADKPAILDEILKPQVVRTSRASLQ